MSAKNLKNLRNSLKALSLAQLVALASQKTDVNYQLLLHTPRTSLIELLVSVECVLKPVEA